MAPNDGPEPASIVGRAAMSGSQRGIIIGGTWLVALGGGVGARIA